MNIIYEFAENGQDYHRWLVSPEGEILDCDPLMAWPWRVTRVIGWQKRLSDGKMVLIVNQADKLNIVTETPVIANWKTKAVSFSVLGAVA